LAQIADRIIVVHPVTATTNLGKNSPNSFQEGGVNHDYFEQPDSGPGFAQEPQSLTEPVS